MLEFKLAALGLLIVSSHHAVAQNELQTSGVVERDAGERNGLSMLEPEELSDDLSTYVGVARPVVVFADGSDDPLLTDQLEQLNRRARELEERDVVLLIDTDPVSGGTLRQQLRPHGFTVVLLDKDGGVALRQSQPTPAQTLVRLIDRMPLRREEIDSSKSR
jgi:hypothetical protein